MTRSVNTYPLRMDKQLRERLEEKAQQSGRTLRAEILMRLQDSFAREDAADYLTGQPGDVSRDDIVDVAALAIELFMTAQAEQLDAGKNAAAARQEALRVMQQRLKNQ